MEKQPGDWLIDQVVLKGLASYQIYRISLELLAKLRGYGRTQQIYFGVGASIQTDQEWF